MIKITYKAEPFYCDCAMNEPCTKDLEVVFDEDSCFSEIIAEIFKVLYYAGYHRYDKENMLSMIQEFIDDGIIDEKSIDID